MIKPYICYKKNCWTTAFSVLAEAFTKEEEHPNDEDLAQRSTLHTHKGNEEKTAPLKNTPLEENPEENNIDYDDGLILNYETIENKKARNDENQYNIAGNNAGMGHEHDSISYNEFLIEKSPTGGLKQSTAYLSVKGQLLKKGIMLQYLDNKFNMY